MKPLSEVAPGLLVIQIQIQIQIQVVCTAINVLWFQILAKLLKNFANRRTCLFWNWKIYQHSNSYVHYIFKYLRNQLESKNIPNWMWSILQVCTYFPCISHVFPMYFPSFPDISQVHYFFKYFPGIPKLLGLGRQIGQIHFGAFGVFSAKLSALISTHIGTVSPLSLVFIIQPLFLQNTNALSFYVTKTVLVRPKWF